MRSFHELLAHHASRVRSNPNNEYASGAVDALLELVIPELELESVRRRIVEGTLDPWVLRGPNGSEPPGPPPELSVPPRDANIEIDGLPYTVAEGVYCGVRIRHFAHPPLARTLWQITNIGPPAGVMYRLSNDGYHREVRDFDHILVSDGARLYTR